MVGIATLDSKIVLAGGDPSIKDSKLKKQKSNIKQHDHDKLYVGKQKKLASTGKKNISNNNSTTTDNNLNKDENLENAGFAAIEDVPLIIDLSSVTDSDGMVQ
jgi:hypothetical protein